MYLRQKHACIVYVLTSVMRRLLLLLLYEFFDAVYPGQSSSYIHQMVAKKCGHTTALPH